MWNRPKKPKQTDIDGAQLVAEHGLVEALILATDKCVETSKSGDSKGNHYWSNVRRYIKDQAGESGWPD